ncbi:GNAT family N-acetyltransferase [Chitinophaga vietnamensis]|uniref:GNAT family N-acetyltransferase n=1 Tax=Chitinophaga vietnamensis TaxID=2593957 RepID=UPI00117783F5|nr:GNAT family N-acetyltransferase [Chitinophaga vietnamensis]
MLNFRMIEYGSCDYHDMVALRDTVLRKPLGLTFSKEYLQQEINDILIGGFITTPEETFLAGCCILSPVDEDTLQLRQMAVSPRLQGQGIGSEIITFAEQQAINNGFNILMMHARKEATGFYLKLGYQICGDEFTEVGIPHYEMRKNLE